jgi:hypothetical protein
VSRRPGFPWRVWGAPIALAVLSAIGLVAGLVGDGMLDAISWFGLGLPVAVCLWYGWIVRGRP